MKKVFILEENDVEELIKNASITESILFEILHENKLDKKAKERIMAAKSSISVVNGILSKND